MPKNVSDLVLHDKIPILWYDWRIIVWEDLQMKKILLSVILCLLLMGCGVTQEEYEKQKNERNESMQESLNLKEGEKLLEEANQTLEGAYTTFEWKYDENNYFYVHIQQDSETEELSALMIGFYDENNKSLMQYDFAYYISSSYAREIDFSSFYTVGKETYMFICSDGEVLSGSMEIDKYISFPEEYEESFKKMTEELTQFYEENGLTKIDQSQLQTENKEVDQEESNYTPTMGETNALKKAKSYLEMMAFSYNGLIKQLEFEQFSHEESVYAADNCGADWNEQARIKAKSYLDMMAFSKSSLIEQLEFDGFTNEQAVYGVEKNGY